MHERLIDLSPGQLAVRKTKTLVLKGERLLRWALEPRDYPKPEVLSPHGFTHLLGRRDLNIERTDPGADPFLERGKRQNLAVAAPHFNSVVFSAKRPFSFWRTVGQPIKGRGFCYGMELRGGCIVPSIGGGICLFSNALFGIACDAGWSILERHGHTMQVGPDPDGLWGMDATVLWPFVDLRFAPRRGRVQLRTKVANGRLSIAAWSDVPATARVELKETRRTISGDICENRIARRTYEGDDLVADEIVATNRKRVLPVAAQRRNCLTCNEICSARPKGLLP